MNNKVDYTLSNLRHLRQLHEELQLGEDVRLVLVDAPDEIEHGLRAALGACMRPVPDLLARRLDAGTAVSTVTPARASWNARAARANEY